MSMMLQRNSLRAFLGVVLSAAGLLLGCADPSEGGSECGTLAYWPELEDYLPLENDPVMAREARLESDRQLVSLFAIASEFYCVEKGAYPVLQQDLIAFAAEREFRGRCVLPGPTSLLDSWGNAIRFRSDPADFEIRSAGPDGKFGTEDDFAIPSDDPALRAIEITRCQEGV
jgi:Type II secretion system (T2SS), protein G